MSAPATSACARRGPFAPGLAFKINEAVLDFCLLGLGIEAAGADDAPAIEHDRAKRFIRLNPVCNCQAVEAMLKGASFNCATTCSAAASSNIAPMTASLPVAGSLLSSSRASSLR
jgi:hypothetical protein